jgi:hypothetical protein
VGCDADATDRSARGVQDESFAMRNPPPTAVCEAIRPSALREALGVERPRELDPLRRALLTRDPRTAERPRPQRLRRPTTPQVAALAPRDIVSGSPAAGRICEAYHRAYDALMRRGRRQRVGLATFVSAVAVTGATLFSEQRLDATVLRITVLTPAMLSLAALAVLATLGLRDWRRLVSLQGERMVRGIGRGCTLPQPRVEAFLATYPTATTAFLACYQAWRRAPAPRAGSA